MEHKVCNSLLSVAQHAKISTLPKALGALSALQREDCCGSTKAPRTKAPRPGWQSVCRAVVDVSGVRAGLVSSKGICLCNDGMS